MLALIITGFAAFAIVHAVWALLFSKNKMRALAAFILGCVWVVCAVVALRADLRVAAWMFVAACFVMSFVFPSLNFDDKD